MGLSEFMGHICCEKWWNTLVLIQPKFKVYEKWDPPDGFHHILQCHSTYNTYKKKRNIYQRLLTKSSDDWKVFKGRNPINRNVSILLKCTFSYYYPESLAEYLGSEYLGSEQILQSWSYPFPLAALTWSSLWHRNTWRSLQLEKKDMLCYTLHIRHGTSVIIST